MFVYYYEEFLIEIGGSRPAEIIDKIRPGGSLDRRRWLMIHAKSLARRKCR